MFPPITTIERLRDLARELAGSNLTLTGAPLLHVDATTLLQAAREAEDVFALEAPYAEALARLAYAAAPVEAGSPVGMRCALALSAVCNTLGHCTEALALCERVLGGSAEDSTQRARAWLESALGHCQLGNLAEAQAALARVEPRQSTQAERQHAAARLAIYGNRYGEAESCLRDAHEQFLSSGRSAQAARCLRDLGLTLVYVDAQRALPPLERAEATFRALGFPLDLAFNDYVRALAYQRLNRYAEALALQERCVQAFHACGAPFYAAQSESEVGLLCAQLNRYAEAEQHLRAARELFVMYQALAEAMRCDINLGVLYLELQRSWDALPLFTRAGEHALASGRAVRAARCFENMAAVYRQQGRYDQALKALWRARHVYAERGLLHDVATCDEELGNTYQRLSLHAPAAEAYERALAHYQDKGVDAYLARCQMRLGELYLGRTQPEPAERALGQARATYARLALGAQVAECERLLGQAALERGALDEAQTLLANARAGFQAQGHTVQLERCDLLEGEWHSRSGRFAQAEGCFARAWQSLETILPDEAVLAAEGLGRCALARGDRPTALEHYLQGIQLIQRMRAPLPSERLSAAYSRGHQPTFDTAFRLAFESQQPSQALAIAEAAKTTTFSLFLEQRGRPLRSNAATDPQVAALLQQEAHLKRALSALTAQLDQSGMPSERAEYERRAAAYADTIEQLRVLTNAPGAQPHAPFALESVRQALTQSVGQRWLSLVYHMIGETLYAFTLSADSLSCRVQPIGRAVQRALKQCTANEAGMRELVYRGTRGGHATGSSLGQDHLRTLYEWLIPPEAREQLDTLDLLAIVPVGPLHGLPFQALFDGERYLIERVPIVYAPSLNALQTLAIPPVAAEPVQALLCGVADFGERARPLPDAEVELESLGCLMGARACRLWAESATAEVLQRLSAEGELAAYDLIHLATHSIVSPENPLQSRILLHQSELTAADILDLQLDRALVTLSACQGTSGEAAAGDELVSLARVFFYAGAQTLVASQWPVEDCATRLLMSEFYRHLLQPERPARALQQAQLSLVREQAPPYQWAAFSVMGWP